MLRIQDIPREFQSVTGATLELRVEHEEANGKPEAFRLDSGKAAACSCPCLAPCLLLVLPVYCSCSYTLKYQVVG